METLQRSPEHAQALAFAIQEKNEAEQRYLRARRVLDVLLGLLDLPNEEGVRLEVNPDGRIRITRPTKIETPPNGLHIARS